METETKERIAKEALHLFAKKGFSAVSIRDICKGVGIKESTIYYHYRNKQAILQDLLERIETLADQKRDKFNQAFQLATHVTESEMRAVAVHFLTDYLLHPYVYQIIAMLTIERLHDETAEEKYQHIVFELPLEQQTAVFMKMIERGMIRQADPQTIASLYYGVIFAAFTQFCLGEELTQEKIDAACEQVEKGIGFLFGMLQ